MNCLKLRTVFPALLVIAALPASLFAAPVSFDLGPNNSPEVVTAGGTDSRWVIGSGWGTDASEVSSPTLLGATFDVNNALPSVAFSLNAGESFTFNFGSIELTEPNAGGGILAAETDNLDLTAYLFFLAPPGVGAVGNPGVAIAVTGSVSDAAGDLSITFSSVLVNFGNGGQFTIDLQDITFTSAQTLTIDATVTLLAEPVDIEEVPEPSSMALAGTALLSFAGLQWKRRRNRA